jgi:hypothetical protein
VVDSTPNAPRYPFDTTLVHSQIREETKKGRPFEPGPIPSNTHEEKVKIIEGLEMKGKYVDIVKRVGH